jgi:PKD repeat protein
LRARATQDPEPNAEPEPEPEPPVASFTYSPLNPLVNETISFDASCCTDSDGTIVSYSWDFGDALTSTSQNPTHVYVKEGIYSVTLTITGNDGLTDTATASIGEIVIPEFTLWNILPLFLPIISTALIFRSKFMKLAKLR